MTHPVIAFEELRCQAMNTSDIELFKKLFDPAMTYRHGSGVIDHVDSYIEKMVTNQVKYFNVSFSQMTVITPAEGNDTFAVIMGIMDAEVLRPTGPEKFKSHFQTTWHRVGNDWKLLAVHGSTIQ